MFKPAFLCLAILFLITQTLCAGTRELTVRVVKWDDRSGKLVVFLPMHNLELHCVRATRPAAKKPSVTPSPLQAGEYYQATILKKNGLRVEKQVFVIERLILK